MATEIKVTSKKQNLLMNLAAVLGLLPVATLLCLFVWLLFTGQLHNATVTVVNPLPLVGAAILAIGSIVVLRARDRRVQNAATLLVFLCSVSFVVWALVGLARG